MIISREEHNFYRKLTHEHDTMLWNYLENGINDIPVDKHEAFKCACNCLNVMFDIAYDDKPRYQYPTYITSKPRTDEGMSLVKTAYDCSKIGGTNWNATYEHFECYILGLLSLYAELPNKRKEYDFLCDVNSYILIYITRLQGLMRVLI